MDNKYKYEIAGKRIFVAGHRGLLGSSISRRLELEDVEILTASRQELDLTRQTDVETWMETSKPHAVIIAAGKVGGIYSNSHFPADFIYQNTAIELNLINASYLSGIEKLVMLGSSCTYPKMADQPIKESALMEGKPEITNQWNSVAKLTGIKLCEAYRQQYGVDYVSVLPTNLFGPGDNFDPLNSHVIPGMISRFEDAKRRNRNEEVVWGTGKPTREFMYVDEASDGIIFLLKHYSQSEIINVGTGKEISIEKLAQLIAKIVGFKGRVKFDSTKPDGAPRKLLDVSKLNNLGWHSKASFEKGLKATYDWYLSTLNQEKLNG